VDSLGAWLADLRFHHRSRDWPVGRHASPDGVGGRLHLGDGDRTLARADEPGAAFVAHGDGMGPPVAGGDEVDGAAEQRSLHDGAALQGGGEVVPFEPGHP
jgi:hypothetical protein